MTKEIIGTIAVALVALIALAIFISNRRLRTKQEATFEAPNSFSGNGAKVLYVSTVLTEKPLERIWAHGLGVRGYAALSVAKTGIGIDRVGEQGFLIPTESLEGIGLETATIDKGVEKNGLIAIDWRLGENPVTTVLRAADSSTKKQIVLEIEKLIGVAVG
jgi:hypothetical protein